VTGLEVFDADILTAIIAVHHAIDCEMAAHKDPRAAKLWRELAVAEHGRKSAALARVGRSLARGGARADNND
jgi:hypothetical protein